jgi:3-methyladenine DNA glycosylase Mpg
LHPLEMSAAAHGHRLRRDYFNRPTLLVARDLLGKFIVRDTGSTRIAAMINEVEAYKGPLDRAAHTHAGRRTRRVEPLYGDGGTVTHILSTVCTGCSTSAPRGMGSRRGHSFGA